MKVAPVSADLLIKLALAAGAVGLVYYGYKKATGTIAAPIKWVTDALESVSITAGQVAQGVGLNFTQPVADRADVYATNPVNPAPAGGTAPSDYYGTYQNPLINNDGMNFGLL